ncbi:MAG: hypothetical protein K0S33_4173 [Bacteroidetes bacterium]|jgi:vacuolar-type H+-ATPase subunit I/STV1|nr:hypothetical protein [Bacteroidota bacterium]
MADPTQTIDALELLTKVNDFYESAWNKLIIIGTVSFGVIGIIVPIVIQWYQKKTLKISEELLKKDTEAKTLKIKSELLKEINASLEKRLQEFEIKVENITSSAEAKTFHLQGNTNLSQKRTLEALSDYIIASEGYIKCTDYINLQRVLESISKDCISQLSIEEITDLKITDNSDLDLLLKTLSAHDVNGAFESLIREIRFKLSKLPKTIKEKNANKLI